MRLTVHANSIVVGGEIIPFASASFLNTEIEEKGVACVCLKRGESDARTFEDGQERNCMETVTAYLTLDPTGVEEYYKITSLRSLSQLIGEQLGLSLSSTWTSVPVVFYNGYSGSVKYKLTDSGAEVSVDISSSATDWSSDGSGLLFKIADSSLISLLSGAGTGVIFTVPTDSNGDLMGYGSLVHIQNTGKCIIANRTNSSLMATGYIPPCKSGDTKGTIMATLKKE